MQTWLPPASPETDSAPRGVRHRKRRSGTHSAGRRGADPRRGSRRRLQEQQGRATRRRHASSALLAAATSPDPDPSRQLRASRGRGAFLRSGSYDLRQPRGAAVLWGKLIDHDKCIGCHACSVACKSENEVPLGSFRTWVKQVEKGEGLSAQRHFGVLRCNQCEDAPCVAICPTGAMHRRDNGIIDFEKDICIGCKGCIQACPYDAIYMDPVSNTAAKCNFCAHRIEVNLEPACVAVCPTGALVVSDLEDPDSPVARAAARSATSVRKPELGTRPKVFYKGADQSVLDPRAASRPLQGYWGASRGACGPLQTP
ncbi:MAG: 4Fe-4S dicluster domain-containing protein, partial [Planctomycetes bacterium]|nr:4Fe-4S dicluster domain-containing protein [Planctomycetota bacterium]